MAEFQKVMKELGRLCESAYGDCDYCEVGRSFCPHASFMDNFVKHRRAEILENKVMKWAAEHPEPIYMTWQEYLESISVIGNTCTPTTNMYKPIPANIAERLGLKPKE